MKKTEYPDGWYHKIARTVATIFDVSETYVREVARGNRNNPAIHKAVNELCESHLQTVDKIKKN